MLCDQMMMLLNMIAVYNCPESLLLPHSRFPIIFPMRESLTGQGYFSPAAYFEEEDL